MPAKSFSGAMDSTSSVKVTKGTPTLKTAFAACLPEKSSQETSKEQSSRKKSRGKTFTGQFGCNNIAVFREDSATLFCRDHKPKQVPTKPILENRLPRILRENKLLPFFVK